MRQKRSTELLFIFLSFLVAFSPLISITFSSSFVRFHSLYPFHVSFYFFRVSLVFLSSTSAVNSLCLWNVYSRRMILILDLVTLFRIRKTQGTMKVSQANAINIIKAFILIFFISSHLIKDWLDCIMHIPASMTERQVWIPTLYIIGCHTNLLNKKIQMWEIRSFYGNLTFWRNSIFLLKSRDRYF